MELWQLLALLAAGAFGVGTLASSSAKQATAAASKTDPSSLSLADSTLLNKVFQTCMAQENDLQVLQKFATKLAAAGQTAYAQAVQQKYNNKARILLVPQALRNSAIIMSGFNQKTTDTGATYSPTSTTPPVVMS
jgi:hypothetical protein